MSRLKLREWLGMSACAAVLMAGCSSAQRQPAYSNRSMGSVSMLPGYTPGTVFSTSPVESTVSKPAVMASVPAPAAEAQPEKETKIEQLPPAALTSAPAKEVEPIPTVAKSTEPESTPAGYAVPVTGGKDDISRRRCYADITAKACFSHAPDYTWLQGELVYLHSHNCWRVRYASVDEDDKFGGGVNLVETGPMENYKEGQCVRIQGHPSDPENKESDYRVTSIQALPNE
jgi:hypothetical protein